MNILVIEDFQGMVDAYRRVLVAARGHQLTVCATAGSALAETALQRFDLIIHEARLSNQYATRFVPAIRHQYRERGLAPPPFIAVVADLPSRLRRTLTEETGVERIFSKPLDLHDFLLAISDLTGAPKPGDATLGAKT